MHHGHSLLIVWVTLVCTNTFRLVSAQDTNATAPLTTAAPVLVNGQCSKTCDLFSQECVAGECVCIQTCQPYEESVCTDQGKEYESRCRFFQDQCNCKNGQGSCKNKGVENEYIVMYSPCAYQPSRRVSGRSGAGSSTRCSDYHLRLATWLNYMTDLKLRETYVTLEEFEENEFLTGLYTNELHLYAPFSADMRKKVEKLTIYPPSGGHYHDKRLSVLWHCILDVNSNGILDAKELAQLYRVLLPADQCLESFLSNCSNGGTKDGTISLEDWQGPNCFKLDVIMKNCETF